MILLLIIAGAALCQSLTTNEHIVVEVKDSVGVTTTIVTPSTDAHTINIHWWMPGANDGDAYSKYPIIAISGVEDGGRLVEVAQMAQTTHDLLDEPFWPVLVKGYKEYKVSLKTPMQYSILVSWHDNVKTFINNNMIIISPRGRAGASVLLDLKQNQLKKGDKIAIEVYMCSGVFQEIEIYYQTLEGKFMKYRKNDMQARIMEKAYLLPLEIKNTSQAYQFDFFKPQGNIDEAIFRVKLVRLNNESMANLISMHQAMENIDYPADSKVHQKTDKNQVIYKMSPDPYLLNLNNISSPVITSFILESHSRDALRFRLMCSVDSSAVGSMQAEQRQPQTTKRFVASSGELIERLSSSHQAAKRVLYWQERTYTAWSSMVGAKTVSEAIFGNSFHDKETGLFNHDFVIVLLLLAIAFFGGLLAWAIYAQRKIQKKINIHRETSKRAAQNDETKMLTEDREVEMFKTIDEVSCRQRTKNL